MSLDPATVRRIASLARIRVEDQEVEPLLHELNGILGWIEQLNEVNVEGIEPLAGAAQMALKMRADEVTDGGYPEQVLSNAPERIGAFYADEGLEHSWTSRLLARLSGPHALNGRDRLGDALRAQGFELR